MPIVTKVENTRDANGRLVEQTVSKVYNGSWTPYWRMAKQWAARFLRMFDSPAKAQLISFIVDNMEYRDNSFHSTYDEILAKTKIGSRASLAKAFVDFQKYDLIRPVRNGAWCLNPDFLCYGVEAEYQELVRHYHSLSCKEFDKKGVRDDDV